MSMAWWSYIIQVYILHTCTHPFTTWAAGRSQFQPDQRWTPHTTRLTAINTAQLAAPVPTWLIAVNPAYLHSPRVWKFLRNVFTACLANCRHACLQAQEGTSANVASSSERRAAATCHVLQILCFTIYVIW